MPLLSIFIISLNKLVPLWYLRGSSHNILKVSRSPLVIQTIFLLMIIQVVFMYLQSVFGPRYFCCLKSYHQDKPSLYKSKEQLLQINREFEKSDCIICLNPLMNYIIVEPEISNFDEETKDEKEEKDEKQNKEDKSNIKEQKKQPNNKEDKESKDVDKPLKTNHSKKEYLFNITEPAHFSNFEFSVLVEWVRFIITKFKSKTFDFHESRWGRKTVFMLTKCLHAYHSECLEGWLKQKLECPTCRGEIFY